MKSSSLSASPVSPLSASSLTPNPNPAHNGPLELSILLTPLSTSSSATPGAQPTPSSSASFSKSLELAPLGQTTSASATPAAAAVTPDTSAPGVPSILFGPSLPEPTAPASTVDLGGLGGNGPAPSGVAGPSPPAAGPPPPKLDTNPILFNPNPDLTGFELTSVMILGMLAPQPTAKGY